MSPEVVYLVTPGDASWDGFGAVLTGRLAGDSDTDARVTGLRGRPAATILLVTGAPSAETLSLIADLGAARPESAIIVVVEGSVARTMETLGRLVTAGGRTEPVVHGAHPLASAVLVAKQPPSGTGAGPAPAPPWPLTKREWAILRRVLHGETTRMIQAALGIERTTVQTHVQHARAKLGAETMVQLGINAERRGLLRESA